jgi:hypothetical protein
MFLACAVASGAKVIVSGDKALLRTSGYAGIEVCTPRAVLQKTCTTPTALDSAPDSSHPFHPRSDLRASA